MVEAPTFGTKNVPLIPRLSQFSPDTLVSGASVVVTGEHLAHAIDSISLTVGGVTLQVRNASASRIDAVVPGSGDDNVVADGSDDVQIYDPTTNQWTVSDGRVGSPAPLPQARGGTGKAVFVNGEFWVIGGETLAGVGATPNGVYARVDIYDPKRNRWRAGPALTTARHGAFPVLHEGRLLLAGGGVTAGYSSTSSVEVLWSR